MKKLLLFPFILAVIAAVISSCQEDYIRDIEDKPTELIEFTGITASRDSACMFDTIIQDFQLSAGVDIPVWRRVGGIQMSNNWAIQLNFAYNIKL